jgi:S-adenosylmethionine decarboxylase
MAYEYWGYHLMLDCKAGMLYAVQSESTIRAFAKELVEAIDMKAFGEPVVEHFATHNPDAAGHSLLQLIETSNIAGHFVDKNGDFYLDIFSCKPYDIEVAKSVVVKYFDPLKIKTTYLERQA